MPFQVRVDVSQPYHADPNRVEDVAIYEGTFPGEWADVDRAALLAVLLSAKPKRHRRRKAKETP